MQRALTAIVVSGLLLVIAPAAATEASGGAALLRQQINDCMSKRMGADKTLSYNEAMRSCKARLQPAKDTLASNGPAPPAGKAR
jgi:hypothetical protein